MAQRKRKTGLPPGTIIYTGNQKIGQAKVITTVYDEDSCDQYLTEKNYTLPERKKGQRFWIDVKGLHNVELIEQLGTELGIHQLTLEDITDIYARPKWEESEAGIFFLFKTLKYNPDSHKIATEQISIAFNTDTLITFQEDPEDTLNNIRERMELGKGRVKTNQADYLAYTILDLLLDKLYITLDTVEDQLELLESKILNKPSSEHKEEIYFLKRLLLVLRKNILPIREVIQAFERSQNPIIQDSTKVYLRDLSDHIITLSERVDTFREILFSIQELYASEMGIRMNQVIQTLTIITAIFVPVTFIAGVWGMNFEYIPMSSPSWGFNAIIIFMIGCMILMMIWFKKKKWF